MIRRYTSWGGSRSSGMQESKRGEWVRYYDIPKDIRESLSPDPPLTKEEEAEMFRDER